MCELLGMDCNVPTDIVFSFRGFSTRGGKTGPHTDGWGICFYDEHTTRIFREPDACANSDLAEYVRNTSIKTRVAIAHIRKKTRGKVRLANTHPFQRELWGRTWSFAHNGKVHSVFSKPLGRFVPIGTTDSEHAFCWMLDRIAKRFRGYPEQPSKLWNFVAELGRQIAEHGTFNFLMSDGTYLFARCHTNLHHIVRQHPFSHAVLSDEDLAVNFADETTPRDRVAVIATQPLTKNERWAKGAPGSLWVFSAGALRATLPSPNPTQGRDPWPPSTSAESTRSAKPKRKKARKSSPTA